MQRIDQVMTHLNEGNGKQILKAAQAMGDIRNWFHISTSKMEQVQVYFLHEMMDGLDHTEGNIKMLPSFLEKRPTNTVNGDYYALDLGGTNFRVIKLSVQSGNVVSKTSKAFKIPIEHMEGTSEGLFGFIANGVNEVVPKGTEAGLGLTFSFPCQQHSINSGSLIRWTKGFSTSGVEGEDVCKLLEKQFKKRDMKMHVSALCNDTVGTLVTEYFKDPTAGIGVILGTGANACYWEKVKNIPKYMSSLSLEEQNRMIRDDVEMVVNMECGNFDSSDVANALPITPFDDIVDEASPNVGQQRLEKLLSGMYLGEICRLVFLFLHESGVIPVMQGLSEVGAFETWQASYCLGDTTEELTAIDKQFKEKYNVTTTVKERQDIKEVCQIVCERSARLAAAAIGIIAKKMNRETDITVSIDGSVFEKVPGYKGMIEYALQKLNRGKAFNIRLVLTKDGSGVGAGLISALAMDK